jgi:hypothetical protein
MRSAGCAATTVALFGVAVGCVGSKEAAPPLTGVQPSMAFNDIPVELTIDASVAFRPAFQIDTASGGGIQDMGGFSVFLDRPGAARVPATGLTWHGDMELVAALPVGVPAGLYDVAVVDPRGNMTVKAAAFTSLGPDTEAPVVVLQQPAADSVFGAGTEVTGAFFTDDGMGVLGTLSWTTSFGGATVASGACPVFPTTHQQICPFAFYTPAPVTAVDALTIQAVAIDAAGNVGQASVAVTVTPRPMVTTISPLVGPIAGGTMVTISGADFVDPVGSDPATGTEILVDGQAITTYHDGPTSIWGVSPAHDAGDAEISVSTGGATTDAGTFLYVAAPIVREVVPAVGATVGGTPVTVVGNYFRAETRVSFGGRDLACAMLMSPNRIDGFAPPGGGTVDVVATDPVGGTGKLAFGFAFDETIPGGPAPDAGCPAGSGP